MCIAVFVALLLFVVVVSSVCLFVCCPIFSGRGGMKGATPCTLHVSRNVEPTNKKPELNNLFFTKTYL